MDVDDMNSTSASTIRNFGMSSGTSAAIDHPMAAKK